MLFVTLRIILCAAYIFQHSISELCSNIAACPSATPKLTNISEVQLETLNDYIYSTNEKCTANIPLHEYEALEYLYNSTNGNFWTWDVEEDEGVKWNFTYGRETSTHPNPCKLNWQGILCQPNITQENFNDTCNIYGIFMFYHNITGPLLDFSAFQSLSVLALSYNHLTGTIPEQIFSLSNLTVLTLEGNFLSRSIPDAIGNARQLIYLDLSANSLTSTIPTALGNLINLFEIWLFENSLTGHIPSQLSRL